MTTQNSAITTSQNQFLKEKIAWPSGQFAGQAAGNINACLIRMNSSFGFNENPHNFELQFAPIGPKPYHGASGNLPDINTLMDINISNFRIRGRIKHTDWNTANNGTLFRVRIEDDRSSLSALRIHTEDMGEVSPSGIASVARAYRINNPLKNSDGTPNTSNIFEYEKILDVGSTYSQILDAIDLANSEGNTTITRSQLPTVVDIEANIGGDAKALRFKFETTPLDTAITNILADAAYDWYWHMDQNKVQLINRRVAFNIDEDSVANILVNFGGEGGVSGSVSQYQFGQDLVEEPTQIKILGARQQGFLNGLELSDIDGLNLPRDGTNFTPAWGLLTISFYDAFGILRQYRPKDKELELALLGIEQWSYYKKYQTTSTSDPNTPGYGFNSDAGHIAAQHTDFQSRIDPTQPLAEIMDNASGNLRYIDNRRDVENNWINTWFGRVNDLASRHYGRTYVASGILYNNSSGVLRIVDAAWANVENQVEGFDLAQSGSPGPFTTGYQINKRLGKFAPFIRDDYRVGPWVKLPSNTVYGPFGEDAPASFQSWTEDAAPFNPDGDGSHYIPCDLVPLENRRVKDPRQVDVFEAFPEGSVICQLPIQAASGIKNDNIIANLATLTQRIQDFGSSGIFDILHPARGIQPYGTLSGVGIPVEVRTRYGENYPDEWISGTPDDVRGGEVVIDEAFSPWNFFPIGNSPSIDVMSNRAFRRARGLFVDSNTSRYANINQAGLPKLSYNSFASQLPNSGGLIGVREHGVTDLNLSIGREGFTTQLKIASFFSEFGRPAPLGDRPRARIDGIINPIDFSQLNALGNRFEATRPPSPNPNTLFILREERVENRRVVITEINNKFVLADCATENPAPKEELYFGEEQGELGFSYGREFPNRFQKGQSQGAPALEGYFNLGDEAVFNIKEFFDENGDFQVRRYFTGGRKFGLGQVVKVQQINSFNGSNYDVTIFDPNTPDTSQRALCSIPVLNGSVNVGEKTQIVGQENAPVKPGSSSGIFLAPGGGGSVTPVEIISITNLATATARATCQTVGTHADETLGVSGVIFNNVIPLPFPELATSGDRGYLTTSTPSGEPSALTWIHIPHTRFLRFD